MKRTISELQKEIHSIAKEKGFYEERRNIPTRLMLVVSEISEAMEADRSGKRMVKYIDVVNGWHFVNDFIPYFENHCKDTFEDELADAVIRILDLAESEGINLEAHIIAKIRYNKTREIKHGNKRY